MAVSAVISVFLPVALYIYLRRRARQRFFPVLVGVFVFPLAGLLLKGLADSLLRSIAPVQAFLTSRPWIAALYVGLMAGLFEESGRLCAFFFILGRRHNGLNDTLAYGVGHGGIESILLAGLPLVSNLVAAVFINTSGTEALTVLFPGGEAVAGELARVLTGTPPITFLAGGVERVIAIAFHLAASVLVWMAASTRGPWGLYFLAVLCHAATNFAAGLYHQQVITNVWAVEGITAAVVAAVCFMTYLIYEKCSQSYTALLHYNPSDFGI